MPGLQALNVASMEATTPSEAWRRNSISSGVLRKRKRSSATVASTMPTLESSRRSTASASAGRNADSTPTRRTPPSFLMCATACRIAASLPVNFRSSADGQKRPSSSSKVSMAQPT